MSNGQWTANDDGWKGDTMTWFPDMACESMVAEGEHVRAVGWLSSSHPYTRRRVSLAFVAKLRDFVRLADESTMSLYFGVSAGFHLCEFCRKCRDGRNFGVPAGEVLFVAPAMIGHYVEQHKYAPPPEFIAAVSASPLPGTPEYQAACAGFRKLHQQQVAEWARRQQ